MATNASDLLGDFLAGGTKNAEGLDSDFLAGGGATQAEFLLNFFRETEGAEQGRAAGGLDLIRELIGLQRDPTNFAAAIQAQGLFGGNAATAAAARGGAISENPNNALLQALIGGIGEFALGDGNLPAGASPGSISPAQAAHNAVVGASGSGGKQPSNPSSAGTSVQSAGASVFDPNAGGDDFFSEVGPNGPSNVTPGMGNPKVTPSIDRALLPDNVQAAIKQFEAGQGNTTSIMQSIKDHELTKLNESNVAKIAAQTTPPHKRGLSNIEAMFDTSTLEGGHTLTSPQLIEQTIRNAIGKRQTKKGARNQVLASAVGRAVNGAA